MAGKIPLIFGDVNVDDYLLTFEFVTEEEIISTLENRIPSNEEGNASSKVNR